MRPLRLCKAAYGAVAGLAKVALLAAAPAWAEPVTIAALGDSLTQGYGLPAEDGFVPQLEAWLRENGADVRVLNAGVSGDTTAGGLNRIGWTLDGEVDAVIVTLGGNDLLRAIPPEASRANLAGILEAIAAEGLPAMLIGLSAPRNYGDDYKAAFDAMYPELAEAHGALYVGSFFAGFPDDQDPAAMAALMQPDGIHPSAEGVAAIVDALGPRVLDLVALARP